MNVYSTPQNARRDHIVKIVIPAFIKQHIVQDFMMGRSWVFILHPFPASEESPSTATPTASVESFRKSWRFGMPHGGAIAMGMVQRLAMLYPVGGWTNPRIFSKGFFMIFRPSFFHGVVWGYPRVSPSWWVGTNPSGCFFVSQIGSCSPQFWWMKIKNRFEVSPPPSAILSCGV